MARGIVWRLIAVLVPVLLAGAGFLVVGCSGPKPNYKYRIAVIPKGLTHEHWQSVHRGAQRAADDLKEKGLAVEVIWDGPRTESDAQEQIRIVDRHVANRVSGFVLAPQHSQSMVAPVERAARQNIPVVIIDSDLTSQEPYIKYVATNNKNGGKLAAERLLQVLRAEGKPAARLIMLRYEVGSESTEQREKGFEEVISQAIAEQGAKGEPTLAWLSNDQYAGGTVDSALKISTPLLNRLKREGIDGIYAPNESSTAGMLKAMESLNLNKKVKLVGFDSSPPLLQAVKDGDIDGLILQDPYRMGYLGLWTVVQHLEGFDVAPRGEKYQGTGEFVITRENIDDPATLELYDPKYQAKRQIQTPEYSRAGR